MSYSIIIPSRNPENLKACIARLREMGEDGHIIVVWDRNDEAPAPVAALVSAFGGRNFTFIYGDTPFVFARNINIGIRAAGIDDVVLLNDDALLETPRGFARLAELSKIGPLVLSPAVDSTGNPNQAAIAGTELVRPETRMVCFMAVYIPQPVYYQVGMLDERYVDYGCDDDDYCKRVTWSGFKLGVVDSVCVNHSTLPSTFRPPGGAGGDFRANLKRFIEKWGVDNWGLKKDASLHPELFP